MAHTGKENALLFAARGTAALFLALLLAFFCSCAPKNDAAPAKLSFRAMDTLMELSVYGGAVPQGARELVLALEAKLSVTDPHSELAAANLNGEARLSPETAELLNASVELSRLTNGAFDPTVRPLVRAWGFTTDEYRVPDAAELATLLPLVGVENIVLSGDSVRLQNGAMLDLGAIAKGYASDRVAEYLKACGVESAIVNLGGNVLALGKKHGAAWSVAINDPEADGAGYACLLKVSDCAVVTSGGYERFFEADGERYSHIIDPSTGYPVRNELASVTVVSTSGTAADALSTALYVMGLDGAIEFYKTAAKDSPLPPFELVLITHDGDIFITEGLQEGFSPRGRFEKQTVSVVSR